MKYLLVTLLSLLSFAPAQAAERNVTLDVPGMNCGMCPITVKKALKQVPGVKSAKADLDSKQAVVVYDDAKTTPEQLVQATTDAGYPSSVKGDKK